MSNYFHMEMTTGEIATISNLGLAHLGDAVYELMVRTWLIKSGKATANGLHRAAVNYVSARAQAKAAASLLPHLTKDEQAVYRRGRNTHVKAVPQNATLEEYHAATGLEALFGHLYLKGETARISALFALTVGGQDAI